MRSRTPDRLCAEAVDLARAAAEEAAAPGVGRRAPRGRSPRATASSRTSSSARSPATGAGAGRSRWPAPPAPRSSPWTRTVLLPGSDARARARVGAVERTAAPRRHGPRRPAAHRGRRPAPGARLHRRGRAAPPSSAVSEELAELVEAEDAEVTAGTPASLPVAPPPRLDRRGRRGTRPAPRPGAVPLRPAHRRRPLGRGVRRQDADGAGGARATA